MKIVIELEEYYIKGRLLISQLIHFYEIDVSIGGLRQELILCNTICNIASVINDLLLRILRYIRYKNVPF